MTSALYIKTLLSLESPWNHQERSQEGVTTRGRRSCSWNDNHGYLLQGEVPCNDTRLRHGSGWCDRGGCICFSVRGVYRTWCGPTVGGCHEKRKCHLIFVSGIESNGHIKEIGPPSPPGRIFQDSIKDLLGRICLLMVSN